MLIRQYFSLIKPGIIFGNLITACGGFFLAHSSVKISLLLLSLLGISLVIASGCVFNNFFDRDIDKLMERTKNRPSALGLISGKKLIFLSLLLGVCGFFVLYFGAGKLAASAAFLGFIVYVFFYTLYFKRSSWLGTPIGSISGAIPPVVGYCAASGVFDSGALILFFMLVFWQMPHSYAIAIYRLHDYRAAAIPVLPVKKSLRQVQYLMLAYVFIFSVIAILPTVYSYTGMSYFFVSIILNAYWIYLTAMGLKSQNETLWAKKVFFFSLIVITFLCLMMIIDRC